MRHADRSAIASILSATKEVEYERGVGYIGRHREPAEYLPGKLRPVTPFGFVPVAKETR